MKTIALLFLSAFLASAQTNLVSDNSQASGADGSRANLQRMIEERDLLAMAVICTTPFWVSSNGVLYLYPKRDRQDEAIQAYGVATSGYLVLTNKSDRRVLIAKYIAASDVDQKYQEMILHAKRMSVGIHQIARYKMMQSLESGDALIQDDDGIVNYVYNLGRAADDKYYGDAELLRAGLKTYATAAGGTKTVESYLNVSLSDEEKEVLSKIAASLSKRVSDLTPQINSLVAEQKKPPRMN